MFVRIQSFVFLRTSLIAFLNTLLSGNFFILSFWKLAKKLLFYFYYWDVNPFLGRDLFTKMLQNSEYAGAAFSLRRLLRIFFNISDLKKAFQSRHNVIFAFVFTTWLLALQQQNYGNQKSKYSKVFEFLKTFIMGL